LPIPRQLKFALHLDGTALRRQIGEWGQNGAFQDIDPLITGVGLSLAHQAALQIQLQPFAEKSPRIIAEGQFPQVQMPIA